MGNVNVEKTKQNGQLNQASGERANAPRVEEAIKLIYYKYCKKILPYPQFTYEDMQVNVNATSVSRYIYILMFSSNY